MKIGSQPDIPTAAISQALGGAAKSVQATPTSVVAKLAKEASSAGVAVTVSTLARTLEATNKGQAADVDLEKVNSIRNAIERGTFTVNPEAIADKLLGNAQEMLSRSRI